MNGISEFESRLPQPLRTVFQSLKSPTAVQAYLDGLPYKAEELDRSPLQVMTDGQAHCLDGGIFAALALWRIGFRPLLLDLVPAPGMDDDHVLALFQVEGLWDLAPTPPGQAYAQHGELIVASNARPGRYDVALALGQIYNENYAGWVLLPGVSLDVEARPLPTNGP